LEKNSNMSKKENALKTLRIVKEYKSQSNKDLLFALDFIQEDFELTKNTIIKLTEHLDKLEITYNTILTEYENRNTNGGNRTNI
jgi:hypothetical protein